jgi:hypothetical protein
MDKKEKNEEEEEEEGEREGEAGKEEYNGGNDDLGAKELIFFAFFALIFTMYIKFLGILQIKNYDKKLNPILFSC